MEWNKLANETSLQKTIASLKENGIDAIVVDTGADAKNKILELLPKSVEVMPMTSVTLDTIGVSQIINDSGDYDSLRDKLNKLDRVTQSLQMQKLGAAPEWTVG